MKNMKNKMKMLTAGAFAGALFLCGFTACETKNDGAENFNITRAQAESIALLHSGMTENRVTAQKITAEEKDGGRYYYVEFVCGNVKYAYRIDGDTGDIVKLSVNGQNVAKDDLPAAPSAPDANYIGEARAKEIALRHAGFAETDVLELETDFDFDDGMYLYEVEFSYGESEYEYELIASTGEIYTLEIDDFSVIVPKPADDSLSYISVEQAKEIALADSGVPAENATFTKRTYADKQGFYIFDCCENFAYFKEHPKGKDGKTSLSLTQKIFSLKLDLVYELQRLNHQENIEHKAFYDKWKAEIMNRIKSFNRNLINVRHNLQYVDKYSVESAWDYIGVLDLKELKKQIIPLAEAKDDFEAAKSFDLWLFNMELAELEGEKDYSQAVQVVTTICSILLDMTTIPEIAQKKEFLKTVTQNEFWENITITRLEDLRNQVRDLIRFLPREIVEPIRTNFEDKIQLKRGEHLTPQFKNYKQRVIDYLSDNVESPVIHKIRNVIPLTSDDLKELQRILWEELGCKDDYDHIADGESVGVFVRKIVGLDREAISKLFAKYLAKYNFNQKQEEFLHQIVTFVLENGDIEPKNLIQDEPFKYLEYTEIFNGNPEAVYSLIKTLHSAVNVAVAA